jgi:hypothetical protein
VDGYYDLTPFKTDGVLEKGREYLNELYQMKRNQHLKKHLIENFDQKVLQKMKQMLY